MRLGLLLLAVAGLVALLAWQFPYVLRSDDAKAQALQSAIWLSLIASGVLASGRLKMGEALRYTMAWVAVFCVVILGYSYKDDILDSRFGGALMPNRIRTDEHGNLRVNAAADGHFYIEARVNGVPVNFMVDTGASDMMISRDDAERIGLKPENLSYTRRYQTANGMTGGAPVRLKRVQIGSIHLDNFPASVNQGEMSGSLMGMSMLSRLGGFSIEGDSLIIGKGTR